jgi:hypothetical protein
MPNIVLITNDITSNYKFNAMANSDMGIIVPIACNAFQSLDEARGEIRSACPAEPWH